MHLPFPPRPRPILVSLALTSIALSAFTPTARADDWPQFLGPQRDGVWRETGIVAKFPAGGPPIEWRAPIGAGYAGPVVASGRVYVTDRLLAPGISNPKDPFAKDLVKGRERVLCLDAAKGTVLWEHAYDCPYSVSYPSGPRATPLAAGGKVYALGAMGDLLCLDAATGSIVWSKNFPKDYDAPVPLWGFAAAPLLDGQRLICLVGGNGGVAAAFDKDTGKELWHALTLKEGNSDVGYAAPVIYDVNGTRQLIVWHPEAVNGLDPATGKVYWSVPFKVKANLTIPMPRLVGADRLFVTSFYNGAMLIQLDPAKASMVWRGKQWQGRQGSEQPNRTDTLHSIMPTPFVEDGYIYGIGSYGELRCLKADTGERVWQDLRATHAAGWQSNSEESPERWGNAFLTRQGDRFFLFNEKGDLIIAKLSPKGYDEVSRAHLLEPTNNMAQGRLTVWTHPAYADRSMFIRNDREIMRVSLAAN